MDTTDLSTHKSVDTKFFVLLLLFMFLDYASLGVIYFYLPFVYFLIHKKEFRVFDGISFLLFIFGLCYAVTYFINTGVVSYSSELLFIINSPVIYMMGKYIWYYNDKEHLYYILFVIALSLALISIISVFKDISQKGFYVVGLEGRNISMIGMNTFEKVAATGLSTRMMPLSFFFVTALLSLNVRDKILIVFFSFVAIFCIVRIQSRTSVIGCSCLLLLFTVLTWKSRSIMQKIFLVLGLVIMLAGLIYVIQNFSDQLAILDRLESKDMETANGRTDRLYNVAIRMFDYPFGGMNLTYAHNTWFDCARLVGIIPFVLLVIITLKYFVLVFKVLRNNQMNILNKTALGLISFAFLFAFMSEPVLEGTPMLYEYFCLVFGILVAERENMLENT